MSVDVTKTGGHRAEITWSPDDDPEGWLARTVQGDELAYALELLGRGPAPESYDDEQALTAARHTTRLARLLETSAAMQVARLRDVHGQSWRRIADVVHGDPEKQSTVRRQYDAGHRQLGH